MDRYYPCDAGECQFYIESINTPPRRNAREEPTALERHLAERRRHLADVEAKLEQAALLAEATDDDRRNSGLTGTPLKSIVARRAAPRRRDMPDNDSTPLQFETARAHAYHKYCGQLDRASTKARAVRPLNAPVFDSPGGSPDDIRLARQSLREKPARDRAVLRLDDAGRDAAVRTIAETFRARPNPF